MSEDYWVTVCDACLRASCWHGDFYCDNAKAAGIKEVRASELLRLDTEDVQHFSRERIATVTGELPCPTTTTMTPGRCVASFATGVTLRSATTAMIRRFSRQPSRISQVSLRPDSVG